MYEQQLYPRTQSGYGVVCRSYCKLEVAFGTMIIPLLSIPVMCFNIKPVKDLSTVN